MSLTLVATHHPFISDTLNCIQDVDIKDDHPEWPAFALNPELKLIPSQNEYYYYTRRVSYLLGHFSKYLTQLEHSINYLFEDSFTEKMEQDGFDRADHLEYNVENYYIRLQSVYDRALQLTNAVFHLGINEKNVNHTHIVSNTKVALSPIKAKLKSLQKILKPNSDIRNTIVHRSGYRDDTVTMIKYWAIFPKKFSQNSFPENFTPDKKYSETILGRYHTAIETKVDEFRKINDSLAKSISPLLDDLYSQYLEECKRIVSYLSPSKINNHGDLITAAKEYKVDNQSSDLAVVRHRRPRRSRSNPYRSVRNNRGS